MAMFKKGYKASREEKERQDQRREESGKKLWRFFLSGDGAEADLQFLTEEPVNFYEHTVKGVRDGKEVYDSFTCTCDDNCPLCADGERATYKGAYLIVDKRPYEYTDSSGNKQSGKDQVRLYVQGMKVVSQLDRMSTKYGLAKRGVTLIRLGVGTQTTYTVEKGDETNLTEKQIENLLPEKLRSMYDGTMDSLYSIVEEQLLMNVKGYDPSDSLDSEEDEEEFDDSVSDKIIGVEEEEAPPKKTLRKKSLFKAPQNSVKPKSSSRAKSLLKPNNKK